MSEPLLPAKKPSLLDMLLHTVSLQIATGHRVVRASNPPEPNDDEVMEDLLTAFRCVRRHINVGNDSKRFGSFEAYQAMQGLI